jgi:Holliday junction resolvase RusA-like endonuclease
LWKLVGDALQGIVFENDAQIEYLELTKCHVERLDEAKTIVEVGNIADWSRA